METNILKFVKEQKGLEAPKYFTTFNDLFVSGSLDFDESKAKANFNQLIENWKKHGKLDFMETVETVELPIQLVTAENPAKSE